MRRPPSGYTLLELVVVLAILGAVTALVGPSVLREGDRWQARLALQDLAQQLSRLPLLARQAAVTVRLDGRSDWPAGVPPLRLEGGELQVLEPVVVHSNGYCAAGRLRLRRGEIAVDAEVLAPFCQLRRLDVDPATTP